MDIFVVVDVVVVAVFAVFVVVVVVVVVVIVLLIVVVVVKTFDVKIVIFPITLCNIYTRTEIQSERVPLDR